MYIKRYTIASLVLIALVGWYVYAYITQETMSIDFFGIHLPAISISIWIIVPLILLYLASVVHMSFYSILGNFRLRKYEKDSQKMIDAICDAYLGKENRKYSFKTARYELMGSLINKTTFTPAEDISINTKNEKINTTLKLIADINQGNVADLKAYNLSNDNQLVIQNNKNKYKNDILKMDDILNNSKDYDIALCQSAYSDFVEIVSLGTIDKHKEFMTKDILFKVLSRINAESDKIEPSSQELISLFGVLTLNSSDYLDIAKALSDTCMLPEDRIKLFETLSEDNEKVMDAYLYTLIDLEMNSIASDILENSQPDEYMKFKAYFALKNANQNYNISLFI